jgi:isoquinoline 1-oxidoreductase beta subunit
MDVGTAINPDAIKGQIEGAVAQAMAATLWAQQTFVNGVPQSTNFNKYRPVRLQEMPQVDVQVLQGGGVGGVGEPGVPCVAPAIANAYAKLTGEPVRKRSLPFFPGTTLGGL